MGFFSFHVLCLCNLKHAAVLYPINISTNFKAIKIVLLNSKNVYIKRSACLTCCISLQECMHISTDKLHHCILSIQRRELLSQRASRNLVVNFWSFHTAYGAVTLTEALAPVMNARSILMLFLYSLPSVFVYFCVF